MLKIVPTMKKPTGKAMRPRTSLCQPFKLSQALDNIRNGIPVINSNKPCMKGMMPERKIKIIVQAMTWFGSLSPSNLEKAAIAPNAITKIALPISIRMLPERRADDLC